MIMMTCTFCLFGYSFLNMILTSTCLDQHCLDLQMLKIFLFVIYFLQYVNAEEYEYYYDDNEVTSQESESETPKDLISFSPDSNILSRDH